MAAEHLDDAHRPAKAGVGPDEDSSGSSSNEEVDQRLGEPEIDLTNAQGRPFPPIEAWVIDVDVEPVLM
jgi:hypothetical protein